TRFEVRAIDISGGTESPGNIALSLDGFSHAYAKLRGACRQAPAAGQMPVGAASNAPTTNPDCNPGGDRLQCLQALSGSPSPQSRGANVLAAPPSANVVHTVPIGPDGAHPIPAPSAPGSSTSPLRPRQ